MVTRLSNESRCWAAITQGRWKSRDKLSTRSQFLTSCFTNLVLFQAIFHLSEIISEVIHEIPGCYLLLTINTLILLIP